jgi:hypothetical protein
MKQRNLDGEMGCVEKNTQRKRRICFFATKRDGQSAVVVISAGTPRRGFLGMRNCLHLCLQDFLLAGNGTASPRRRNIS